MAVTVAQMDAERLVARLAELFDAPAAIAWEPGLRAGRRVYGLTRRDEPERLVLEPTMPRIQALETAVHEFIHSLEFRGLLPERRRDNRHGGPCTELAPPMAAAIAAAALSGSPSRSTLATIVQLVAGGGALPRPLLATQRSWRV
jgi:hypothetical protein